MATQRQQTLEHEIRWFEELGGASLGEAGGKGANLGELTRAGLPVPPGFVVTASAYRAHLARAGLEARIADRLHTLDGDAVTAVTQASQDIQAWLLGTPIAPGLQAAVKRAYADLADRLTTGDEDKRPLAVAVRSSATAEDLPSASFAGQQETFLNVCGEEAVIEAVGRCWASLWTPQAIAYRARQGYDHLAVHLAVVVQVMARADVAGVMFTANPVSGARDEILVSASYGLGEAVVSGMVTPDTFALRSDGSVRLRTLGTKAQQVVADGCGTRVEAVAEAARARYCLNDRDLVALADLARRVQTHYGGPQDTEWALADGALTLLQARPITTLTHAPAATDSQPAEAPLNRKLFGVKQTMEYWPDPPTPLDVAYYVAVSRGTDTLYRLFGMQPSSQPRAAVERADGRVGVREAGPRFTPAMVWRIPDRLLFQGGDPLERWQPVAEAMAATLARWQAEEAAARAPSDLARLIVRQMDDMGNLLGQRFAAVFLARDLLLLKLGVRLAAGRTGAAELEDALMRGAPFRTALQNQAVAWLAQTAAAYGRNSAAFEAALAAFLDEWGARPARGMVAMPSTPTWREMPETVLGLVDALQSDPEPIPTADAEVRRRAEYEAALAWSTAALPSPLRDGYRRVVEHARHNVVAREDSLYGLDRLTASIRHTALRLGERLVQEGRLGAPDDVFFLMVEELAPLAEGRESARERVQRRRAAYARVVADHERGIHWLVSTGSIAAEQGKTKATKVSVANQLAGVAASRGETVGSVRVIRSPEEFARLRRGDVLVAPFTAPLWTPLFRLASAVVTEIGSPVSHAAIVAREYGIPAVVAVPDATQRLRDGDTVRVDGTQGVITVIATAATAKGGEPCDV